MAGASRGFPRQAVDGAGRGIDRPSEADGALSRPAQATRTSTDDIDRLVALTGSAEPATRRIAVANLCTCHVQADDDRVWARLLELFETDDDPRVRGGVLHAITDSTPATRVPAVAAALEARYHDPHPPLRRRIRKTLAHYRRTGQITDAPGDPARATPLGSRR